ncbi:sensor histidine kinase [Nocardioides iriomotensis]|uniref:Sensor histidine kinase n=1 Tax=Nocardioides iriomotensis TaxID=715784 RepID=A0A4Q5IWD7_9ACTN|nr:sensor histidine kinase [Nocardioides iriomotensis]RYU10253.1 sensor histidine kinase [Nocardioides iriomotensis]
MTPLAGAHPDYSHGLLLHSTDDGLVEGTQAFVAEGLESGGQVLVHGTRDRVALMRRALGDAPRLEYGFDEELYLEPSRTLFSYQRRLAELPETTELWVTGTVPLGRDHAAQGAWNRYESSVDEALAAYPFRALCTYDTRTTPAPVIEAVRATHASFGAGPTSRPNGEYVDPAAFLASPLARVPTLPTWRPSATATIDDLNDLTPARHLLLAAARDASAVSSDTVEQFLMAVHEVAANGLVHGAPPVSVTLWADVALLTCRVEDCGPGDLDPLTGLRHPGERQPMGLWVARQLVDDLFITNGPSGGCSIVLTAM